ncbi:MAG: hypothetical protein LAN62_11760 [Acidobacteriia bacterium]|nr:hypothetical protein [Terriglobia bacterium]
MTLATIKSAIEGLPEDEKTALIDWLLSRDREEWDKQIAEDFSAGGRGAKLLEEVDAAIDRRQFKPSPQGPSGS